MICIILNIPYRKDDKEKVKIMDLMKTVEDLIRFRTETGNKEEIEKCLNYLEHNLQGSGAIVKICRYDGVSPVFFAANVMEDYFDVLVIGHIDVVPASDEMFEPRYENGKIFGRGTLDMKSFAAVALNSLHYVLAHKLPIKFGVILSTDEEKGSKSTEAFLKNHPDLNAKIVLDNDVGGDIMKIVARCKNPVFVKITAEGEAAHGSTPWDGRDANENLFKTWKNIRKIYPAFSMDEAKPENTWIDTVHFAKIEGGEVSNVIASHAEALLDFRLIETSNVEALSANLDKCMEKGVSYKVVSASTPVVMKENNPHIVAYKNFAEDILGHSLEFEYIGGATDSREFAVRGATVIMHSGSGEGMHAPGEYAVAESIKQLADIQIKFLEKLAGEKKDNE